MVAFIGAAICLLPRLGAPAAEPSAGLTDRVGELASVIDDDTFALVRFDAARIDDTTVRRLINLVSVDAAFLSDDTSKHRKFVANLKVAGGAETVVVFSTPELPWPSLVFVPLTPRANEGELTRLLRNAPGANSGMSANWRVEKQGNALIAGAPAALARRMARKSAARTELPHAVAAAGDAPLAVFLLPTDEQRRVVEEVLPLLPDLATIPGRTLTRGVRWATLGVHAGERPAVHLTIQSADAAAAAKLAEQITAGIVALGRLISFGDDKPLGDIFPAEYKTVTTVLVPRVTSDRVMISVTDPDSLKAITMLFRERFDDSDRVTADLKNILLALHNYHSAVNRFPPVAIRSKDGRPLLSWRVTILPFLGAEGSALYREFKLDEPWDSPHNSKLIERMPAVFHSPKIKTGRAGMTTYLAPAGKELVFTGQEDGTSIKDITDGTSNTIMLVDAADEKAIIWTKPDDLTVDLSDPKKDLFGHYRGYFLAGMADGSVRRVPGTISAATLRAAFTRAGGEVLGKDW
jgi:hypothetical protein